jgi:hypothetical protein
LRCVAGIAVTHFHGCFLGYILGGCPDCLGHLSPGFGQRGKGGAGIDSCGACTSGSFDNCWVHFIAGCLTLDDIIKLLLSRLAGCGFFYFCCFGGEQLLQVEHLSLCFHVFVLLLSLSLSLGQPLTG